eukprot:878330-Prymnesium_polylepis.1
MDKVFICLVADLAWDADEENIVGWQKLRDDRAVVYGRINAIKKALAAGDPATTISTLRGRLEGSVVDMEAQFKTTALDPAMAAANLAFLGKLDEVNKKKGEVIAAETDATRKTKQEELDVLVAELNEFKEFEVADEAAKTAVMDEIRVLQKKLREGGAHARQAVLTNFRLMRSTSSHMSNYSSFVIGNPSSRCGLKLGRGTYTAGAVT